jgi:membrane fusion protein, heavy metal efflux system
VFLPKPSQRQLGVRTLVAQAAEHAASVELQGRVVADANGFGRVQPTQQGRLEAGPRGMPQVGQAVRKGEVLAVVRFTVNALERSAQQTQIAQTKLELQAAEARLKRLEQLDGIVAQKEIDAAKIEVSLAKQRGAFAAPALYASETLVAPISGVLMSANAAAGQVVDARELLFEIVDTSRLRVEAQAFDAASAGAERAVVSLGEGQTVPLQSLGKSPAMRDAARVLLFKPTGPFASRLAINQPVRVLAQSGVRTQGFAVSTASLAKTPSNQDMVWIHTGAEQFAPRVVTWALLDGSRIVVTTGLKAGDRVVTQGAALVNQVR